jgi:acyl carrier protein
MFLPEDTICGFVDGLAGRPLGDVQPGQTLLDDLGLKPHDLDTLARLIENEYDVKPSADEMLGWKRMQDVTTFIRLNVRPTSCAPTGHPIR